MKKCLLLVLLLMPWLAQADALTALGYGRALEALMPIVVVALFIILMVVLVRLGRPCQ